MSRFRLRLLGEMSLSDTGGNLVLSEGQRRPLAVLAVLALAGGKGARREQVMELLWGDQPEERARSSFNQTLYSLRKALDDSRVVEGASILKVSTEVIGCDVWELEQALAKKDVETALRLSHGRLLDGVQLSQDGAFERWAESMRLDLDFRCAKFFEQAARLAEQVGDFTDAARVRAHLFEADPLNSAAAIEYAWALERVGDISGAHALLTRHSELVRIRLDEAPQPDVARERQRLTDRLAQDRSDSPRPPQRFMPALRADTADIATDFKPLTLLPPPERGSRGRSWLTIVTLFAVCIFALAAAARFLPSTLRSAPAIARPQFDATRLAVLYFDDHSQSRAYEHIAEGLTEALIHELSGVAALSVISRNGVKTFRHRSVPFDSIVNQLRVGTIIEGSTQVSGEDVRVTIQLIDASSGAHVLSRTIDRKLFDLFELEAEVATEAAAMLRTRIGDIVRLRNVQREVTDATALDLVLRSERLQRDAADLAANVTPAAVRSAASALLSADSLLRLAERRDRRWIRPTVDRGWAAVALARLDKTRRAALLDSARLRATLALSIKPASAEALELRGTATWESQRLVSAVARDSVLTREAESDLRASIAADSTRASALATLSQLLRWQGAVSEADLLARKALAADAYLDAAGDVIAQLYRSSMMLGRPDSASAWCARGRAALSLDWRFLECELTLMHQSPETADPKRAWTLVKELEALDPPAMARELNRPYSPTYRRLSAATVSAFRGDRARARAELDRALASTRSDSTLSIDVLFSATWVYLGLGELDSAEISLKRYITRRPQARTAVFRDPLLRRHGIDSSRIDAMSPPIPISNQ